VSERHDTTSPAPEHASLEARPRDVPPPEDRGGLLGFVAHEIRNPLSTALWSAELLARLAPEERSGPRGDKLAGMCLRSLQRLRLLVEDHFLADRLVAGGMQVRAEAVPLLEVVQTIAQKQGLPSVSFDFAHDDVVAWADRGLLERALDGVLAAAGRNKAPVLVTGRRESDRVVLRIGGEPPAEGALSTPRKGTPSDPSGRALALYMAVQVANALEGSITTSGADYIVSVPAAPLAAGSAPK
jgi:K+-sensing histidine kinase KdpD